MEDLFLYGGGQMLEFNVPVVTNSEFTLAMNDNLQIVGYGYYNNGPGEAVLLTLTPAPAQSNYETNGGSITITGYSGSGGAVVIPASINGLPVTSIGADAFQNIASLTSVTMPGSITNLGAGAFSDCTSLTSVYFQGNAPTADSTVFSGDNVTVYYMAGTAGWSVFSANTGVPTAAWWLPNPVILTCANTSFGVQNNALGFTISWATNISVVVEACTNLACPVWIPLQTNTLTNGSCYFSDPHWTNYPSRYYLVCGAQTNSVSITTSDGMALIPAGTFTMGDTLDGESDAIPTNVYVSAFYMDTNLVSYSQWQSVYNWATTNGYSFDNAGSGKAANHPVQTVDWYDAVKWCNARSQQAGLTPVYYTDAGLTQVYTNWQNDVMPFA